MPFGPTDAIITSAFSSPDPTENWEWPEVTGQKQHKLCLLPVAVRKSDWNLNPYLVLPEDQGP